MKQTGEPCYLTIFWVLKTPDCTFKAINILNVKISAYPYCHYCVHPSLPKAHK